MQQRVDDKFLYFEVDFEPYHKRVKLTLKETVQKKGQIFPIHGTVIVVKYVKLLTIFGNPKTETQVRGELNRLKQRVLSHYLHAQKLMTHLEECVHDETEGKYCIRHKGTTRFIERLK